MLWFSRFLYFLKNILRFQFWKKFVILNFLKVLLGPPNSKVVLISTMFHIDIKVMLHPWSRRMKWFASWGPQAEPESCLPLIRFDHVIPSWNCVFSATLIASYSNTFNKLSMTIFDILYIKSPIRQILFYWVSLLGLYIIFAFISPPPPRVNDPT